MSDLNQPEELNQPEKLTLRQRCVAVAVAVCGVGITSLVVNSLKMQKIESQRTAAEKYGFFVVHDKVDEPISPKLVAEYVTYAHERKAAAPVLERAAFLGKMKELADTNPAEYVRCLETIDTTREELGEIARGFSDFATVAIMLNAERFPEAEKTRTVFLLNAINMAPMCQISPEGKIVFTERYDPEGKKLAHLEEEVRLGYNGLLLSVIEDNIEAIDRGGKSGAAR